MRKKLDSKYLEALLACRLIPLDKNPRVRRTGVGEILRQIVGKFVIAATHDDVITSVEALQVCAEHNATDSMHSLYNEKKKEAVLLDDAFNAVNWKAFLHNISVICLLIATFMHNCYSKPLRLFVIGGVEVSKSEGIMQGNSVAMAVYSIKIVPLILMILEITNQYPHGTSKAAAYADDLTTTVTVKGIKYF